MLRSEPLARPQFDPYVSMPALTALRTAVQAGDWQATGAFFDSLTDEDDRAYASSLVSELDGSERFLERVVAELPTAPLPRTLLADRYVVIGWRIRSSSRAQHVSRDQFRQFHTWLRRAEQLLIEVCAEHPGYALAWNARILSARGLELGQSEARRRYDRLSETHPHHYAAQSQLLQQLCPKWSGSWEALHGFARERTAAAPPGSHTGALVAQAHIEHWLELDSGADDRYLKDPAVRDELLAAAAVSVLHPDFRGGHYAISSHGYFAAALSLGGHHAEAAPHFRALGNNAASSPWSYLGDKEAAYLKHRESALAKG
ncbi:hypothetical protein [Streptomyces sp. AK02-01A]|uniref:hypothetical protein n=1 Tax=Streptomyces sp. AK02-01A TaxID=3028648 RepID=UPI0029BA9634|nr:hypothetical protein [Streptomyces sp. AK02-01A]MDX3851267.1 hypothetical protein [Streptomyces sp. AK02-01A]